MSVEVQEKSYKITRQKAARLLGVSTRTVDRYIKSKKLSTRMVDGRVWLSKKELEAFGRKNSVDKNMLSTSDLSIVNGRKDVDIDVDTVKIESTENPQEQNEYIQNYSSKKTKKNVYKQLYTDQKEELAEKQQRLEIANYRIGQLEAQLKSAIPMLEYYAETAQKKRIENQLKTKLKSSQDALNKTKQNLRYEKLIKRLALIILFTIIALQPLWLIAIYK